jgi:hypothetical protein
VALHFFSFAL